MADVRKSPEFPDASAKDLTLMVAVYDRNQHTNPKTGKTVFWADAQIAQFGVQNAQGEIVPTNPQLKPQNNPHLHMAKDDQGRINTTVPYSQTQIQEMANASGEHTRPLLTKEGAEVGKVYTIQADMMFPRSKESKNLPPVANTKTIKPLPEGVQVPTNVMEAQFNAVQANREMMAKAKEAAEAQNPAPAAGAPAPATPQQGAPAPAPQAQQFAGAPAPAAPAPAAPEPEFG